MVEIDLKTVLEELGYQHCRAFRRRAEWCHGRDRLDADGLVTYLNRATASSLAGGTREERAVVDFLMNEVVRPGPYEFQTRIRRTLEEATITDAIRQVNRREEFACAEVYGQLRGTLHDDHQVDHEHYVDDDHRVDLYVRNDSTGGEYLIEGKIADNVNHDDALRSQLELYRDQADDPRHVFVLVFAFDDDYWRVRGGEEQAQLEEYVRSGTATAIDDVNHCTPIVRLLPPAWK